jgi:Tfp pilus assembly protein PilX
MKTAHPQNGLALPSVLVLSSLVALIALSSWRTIWVQTLLLNAQADHLRATHQAQAAMAWAKQIVSQPAAQQLPRTLNEFQKFRQQLPFDGCRNGLCALNNSAAPPNLGFWKIQIANARQIPANFSVYGDSRAWCWLEILPDAQRIKSQAPDPFIYRITVLAQGLKPASQTVLQAIWQNDVNNASSGRWLGWKTLTE